MSAYDNPRIINDQSAMAWANAAAKLSETMVQSIQNMVKFRQQQKAVANEKQDRFNLAWNKVALAQNKNLRETIKASKEQGVDISLVKQFQNIQKTIMQGGEGMMGSIEAQTLLLTKSNLSKEERDRLANIVNRAEANIDSIIEGGGKIMTDVEMIKGYAGTSGPNKGMFWEGKTTQEKIAAQLAGFSLAEMKQEGVVSTKEATYTEEGNFVTVNSTLSKDNDIIKGLDLDTDFITDNGDGTVTFQWQKNLDLWDGNLLNKTLDGTDFSKIAQEQNLIGKSGELVDSLRTRLTPKTQDGNGYRNVISREFVDIQALDSKFQSTLQGRAANILGQDNPEAIQAYLEQRLGMGEVKIDEFLKLSQSKKVEIVTELEMIAMREHYDLVPEVDGADQFDESQFKGKINPRTGAAYTDSELNEIMQQGQTPGFKLVIRKLDQSDIEALQDRGIQGYVAGQEGYFYETVSTVGIPKTTSSSRSGTRTQFDKIYKQLFKDIKAEDADLASIFADAKPTPATYGESGLKIYYAYDPDKGGVRKYEKNAAGNYEFTGNVVPQSVLKTIYR